MNLSDIVKDPNATLIDVREPSEFAGGHVEGSLNIPLGQVPQRIAEIKEMPRPLLLFCRSGNRSGMAVSMLQANGLEEVYNAGAWDDVAYLREEVPAK